MAKVLCMFALAGLAAGAPAPAALRVSAAEQDAVVNNIMYSLQPAIDAAITRALSAQSGAAYSSSGLETVQGASNTQSVHFQTAGAQGVVYGGQGSQQSTSSSTSSQQSQLVQGVMAALIPSIQTAVDAALAKQQSSYSTQEQSLTARIIQVLYPSITASVRSALAARTQVQAPVVVTTTQQTSYGTDSSALIAQIVAALRPSIALSVEEALNARSSYSNNQGFSSGGSSYTSSSGSLTDLFGDGKTLNVRVETPEYQVQYDSSGATDGYSASSVGTGYNSGNSGYNSGSSGYNAGSSGYNSGSSSYNSGSSSYNTDRYNSGSSSYNSGSSGSLASLFGDGKSHAVRVQTPEFQIAYDEDSSDVSSSSGYNADTYNSGSYNSGSYNSGSYSSGSTGYNPVDSVSSGYSSGSLRDVFGDGKSHNVKVETPEYKIEYNS